jgi:hypothetical protein
MMKSILFLLKLTNLLISLHHVFSIDPESLFMERENGKVRRDLYDPPPPIVVLPVIDRDQEKNKYVPLGRKFLEDNSNWNRRSKIDLSDEEIEELIYGPPVHDPLQVDWDRERQLLNWRQAPHYFNDIMTKSDTNHPFDKTRRCLAKMFHIDHNLTSRDCLKMDSELIDLRNTQMSMSIVDLFDWELYDSKKSKNDFIRQLKRTREQDDFRHVIVVEFDTKAVSSFTLSLCDMYLYWISYEVQNATCIPISSTSILFVLSNQTSQSSDEKVLDYLSRFKEVVNLSWRGFSSNPKESQSSKDDQIVGGYSNEEHFMHGLFSFREY